MNVKVPENEEKYRETYELLRVQSLHNTAKGEGLTPSIRITLDAQLETHLEGDALLIATGRKPMIDDLNLEKAKIQVNAQGGTHCQ